ncbi:MAG TPA: glycosyltransferase family 4 protein [Blastocatellia bacterium]|nr:glycosyltransferase family 4 protein [Blastocatellia bacterium]HMZ22579.1 glycosyltransferase family 4 protein [Blastocatellia bacterium]HNG34236.1 glycosyltransferase family 4 protein [Blastocatellia bacterium]
MTSSTHPNVAENTTGIPPRILPKILIAGDAAVPSGFARVIEGIFGHLSSRYEIHHLGTNYSGDPHPYDWKVYPAGNGGDIWGANRLAPLIEKLRPRLIFIVNDIWIQHSYMQALAKLERHPPVVLYCPIDGGPIDAETIAPLGKVTRFVAYTQFGRRQVEVAVAAQRRKDAAFKFPEIEVIPHGVDAGSFHPLPEVPEMPEMPEMNEAGQRLTGRQQARRKLFGHSADLDERFIVLNANRNQPRKRIDITIRGFAEFARGKPDTVKLFLHMGAEDLGWNVIQLARRYGIEDRVIMTSLNKFHPASPREQLNLIYNACDVGINTSTAEGWGLVSFEHAAAGAAQIVPRHSACAELWQDESQSNALLLEPAMSLIYEKILTEGWLVTPESVAEALEQLYRNRELLAEMSARAYSVATRPEYRWQAISERWDAMFLQVLDEGRAN